MKKFIVILKILGLLVLVIVVLSYMFDFTTFLKKNLGGNVVNKSNRTIVITDSKDQIELPAGHDSKSIGVFDADTIIIDSPISIDGVLYKKGVFKFCDVAVMEVRDENSILTVKSNSAANFCKVINDFKWVETLEEINY